jgi:phosphoribosyl-ATP pyrophosphohydrolase/phosphoribosyl-AMP cyclohydrolase
MTSDVEIKFDSNGLIPSILQDSQTKRVLMLAYMNMESLELTRELGTCHFFSRSRNEIWHKGSTSGNYMKVDSIEIDCDSDALLISVTPSGPACHNGTQSCFDTHSVALSN